MDLKDIISISGKSGLFSVIGKSKNNVIVESITDKDFQFSIQTK